MVDLLKVEYARTGKSANINEMGMREMQARPLNRATVNTCC